MKFFGIDLGTSTCSVSYTIKNSRPNVVPRPEEVRFCVETGGDEKSPAVPSIVARPRVSGPGTGETLFGFEAERAVDSGHVRGERCREVFRSVKSHLGTGRSYVRADPSLNTPVKVWAGLIRRLCEMTVAAKGPEYDPRKHPTVLTVPASFGSAQRNDTIAAARLAGFTVEKDAKLVQLIDEPVAAFIDVLNHSDIDQYIKPDRENTVLVFDFGGGTCDLVALKFRYDPAEPTGITITPQSISPYQQLGGDTIDAAIMEEVVWPQVCRLAGVARDRLTALERKQVEDELRYKVCRRLKALVNNEIARLSDGPRRPREWSGVARSMPVNCAFGDRQLVGDVRLSADDLDSVMLPFLDPDPSSGPFTVGEAIRCEPFSRLVEITLERAGLTADRLDLLVLHGGSCKSPLIRMAFEEMQGAGVLSPQCKIIQTPDLTTSVARGAALFGCLSSKYAKPYVRPIVPEDLWIQTEGNRPEVMVTAGQPLPYQKTFEKEFRLATAGQPEIVIPIHVGHDPENSRLVSTLTIPIKPRLPRGHLVQVELRIDADKESHWRFRPSGCEWSQAEAVENCWIDRAPSENVRKLQDTRGEIRGQVDQGVRPPLLTLAREAIQAARAGYSEEGLALVEALITEAPCHADLWNYKAMIHALNGDHLLCLESYEAASTLEPDSMVFRGNMGTALVRVKRYREGVAVMRDALSRDPTLNYLHSWLAAAFQALQDTDELNKELERCLAHARREAIHRPDDVSAWEDVRAAATRVGRYADADEALERIGELRRPRNLLAGAKHG